MIIGLPKLNLEPGQADYLAKCLTEGKSWFVIRKRAYGRCVQASGETRERVQRTLDGWPGSTLIQVIENKVHWI